jgi:hypothetical protein
VPKSKDTVEVSVEAQDTQKNSVAMRKEPFVKRNSKWSYDDVKVFWVENSIITVMTGMFKRVETNTERRYRMLVYKAVGSKTAYIASEYQDQDDKRLVMAFGSIEFGVKDCNRRDVQHNPNIQLIQVQDFVYKHLNRGNMFQSHVTPLVTIDPMNGLVAGFCEAWIHGNMDHPDVVNNLLAFRPESFMKTETVTKITNLVAANHNQTKKKKSMKGELAKVDVAQNRLTVEDIFDADLAFERFDLFREYISENQPTDHTLQFRNEAEANFEIAKKLSS